VSTTLRPVVYLASSDSWIGVYPFGRVVQFIDREFPTRIAPRTPVPDPVREDIQQGQVERSGQQMLKHMAEPPKRLPVMREVADGLRQARHLGLPVELPCRLEKTLSKQYMRIPIMCPDVSASVVAEILVHPRDVDGEYSPARRQDDSPRRPRRPFLPGKRLQGDTKRTLTTEQATRRPVGAA
jgi:hypothetical protein